MKVKVQKITKKSQQHEIDLYNQTHVFREQARIETNNYEEEELYFQQMQMLDVQTPKPAFVEEEETSLFLQSLMLVYPLSTLISIYAAVTYYLHFNFADGLIRLIYTIFLFVYPFVTYLSCLIIAGSLNRVVLDEQDKLPQNAEFLDFEDDEEDIMRKATIMIVKRRIFIQRVAMPFIQITGWFKVMSHKDFLMQIYISYLIEIIVFSLPITILILINNAMLQKWNQEVVVATSVIGFNLLLNLRNVISISDLLN